MSKLNREVIEKNKDSIKRGAYYFGIVGRLSIIFGCITGIPVIISMITYFFAYNLSDPNLADSLGKVATSLISCAESLIYGFLFLMARDAFTAINALSNEMEEIV